MLTMENTSVSSIAAAEPHKAYALWPCNVQLF
jgi:hypothetical protein